ncbi:LTA synthase family protein [Hydrogenoanaerobacterium sp.]|uniref:LTA synthase family protein n=1 Tax=Hydrogenoanaerobacterium sp. TaxID=2953763 RepID=UPI0028964F98|nr:LTA synthase family protein [Hydrogenoanaerobacterium sp.]
MNFVEYIYNRIKADRSLDITLTILTVGIFPLMLVLVVENTHLQSLPALLRFMSGSIGVLVYDYFFVAIIFAGLALILRQVWLAMFVEGCVLYSLSLVEYFKFDANGTHFSIADLVMAGKVSDIARFTKIDINFVMVINLTILILYVLWTAFLRIRVNLPVMKSLSLGAGTLALLTAVISVPAIYTSVYKLCGIDYQPTYSPYSSDEVFQNNMQIAFLSQNISERITQKLSKPQNYSEDAIEALLPEKSESQGGDFQSPDVILIMSEAYTDFRRFDGLSVPKDTYSNFDRLSREGYKGKALVPTFGGYTCKTEFELLFGLPVKGIGNEDIPHQLFTDGSPRPTFASYLKKRGYTTSFLHPFSASFYNRDKAYKSYGFDNLYFENDFTVKQTRLGGYIDDSTLVRQIQATLKQGGDKPNFIFAVSMQNHGPYTDTNKYAIKDSRLTAEEQAEVGRYLYGIGQTDKALNELTAYLKTRSKPTVLMFIGDHYPYLGKQGALYKKLTKSVSGYSLYQQPYLLWSNYRHDYALPQERVSAFYLPHILGDYINLPKDRFLTDMQQMMRTTPQYSFDLGENSPDAQALQEFTYDRTQGEAYSASARSN